MAEFIYTMKKVRKAHGDKVILDDVTLSFYPGAKIGVVGPNGAGKSSVLRIMAGLDKPNNGEAFLATGASVGILQQEPPLNEEKTVRGNVEEAVKPLLASGTWVLLDRFVDSSLAYQGAGRELGVEQVRSINRFATGGLEPDRTLLLVVDPEVGRSRSRARAEPIDRLEAEQGDFFARIGAAYLELAATEPDRIRTIDGSASREEVRLAALTELADLL